MAEASKEISINHERLKEFAGLNFVNNMSQRVSNLAVKLPFVGRIIVKV